MLQNSLDISLAIPDLWQQDAFRKIQDGYDVVVSAPTGAGKTYIFELLVESHKNSGQLIYTVPTRALANDKLLEWKAKGWDVGISTGDIADNLDAPVIVATLETQKVRLFRLEKPELIVIDEYQMIADDSRGVNYEMVVALAPPETQLLMLSGSVQNPQDVVSWLKRIGRKAALVETKHRPVPQEQIYLESLPDKLPKSVFGFWPRNIAKALVADLGPILIFAPQRKDSERIARQIAASLPQDDPLELSSEQKKIAGEKLTKLLKTRVAYHHSGLSYLQRAGVVEPLAKAGQLRVVVATTGLGAGINFSMRSVLITEREYRAQNQMTQVRRDELLQMFGRAGRRGLDTQGYILCLPDKPRLDDAAPLRLRRSQEIDWPSFINLMAQASERGQSPKELANILAEALFADEPPRLGFEQQKKSQKAIQPTIYEGSPDSKDLVTEIQNSQNTWERRKGPVTSELGKTLCLHNSKWKPSHQVAASMKAFPLGTTSKWAEGKTRVYGKSWNVAQFPSDEADDRLTLSKTLRKSLRKLLQVGAKPKSTTSIPKKMHLDALEKLLKEKVPHITNGGRLLEMFEQNGSLVAKIDMRTCQVIARKDSHGKLLLNAPERVVENAYKNFSIESAVAVDTKPSKKTPFAAWLQLGLIDEKANPTQRGNIFSYFNHGEGLAVAAALEDRDYPVEQLYWDLANLRTGHRFDHLGDIGNRLSYACRETYGTVQFKGYLKNGLPEEYGDGGSELVQSAIENPTAKRLFADEQASIGDVERVILEWKSILRQIANAPEYPWDRWIDLQKFVRTQDHFLQHSTALEYIPELSQKQRNQRPSVLRFR
jgi:superfamily II DNA/RNA helicase